MKKYATKNNLIISSVFLFALGTPVLASNITGTSTQKSQTVAPHATETASVQSVGPITATSINSPAEGTVQAEGQVITKTPLNKTLDQFLAEQSKNKPAPANPKQVNSNQAAPVQNKPKNSTPASAQHTSQKVTNPPQTRGLNKAPIHKMEYVSASGMWDNNKKAGHEGEKEKHHEKEKHGNDKEKHKKGK